MHRDVQNLLQKAVDGLIVRPFAAFRFDEDSNPFDWIRSDNQFHASISFVRNEASAFSRDGATAIAGLAREIRKDNAGRARSVSAPVLRKVIANEIVSRFGHEASRQLTAESIAAFEKAIEHWFEAQGFTRRHLVPCAFSPWPAARFTIGPITFFHVTEFNPAAYGVDRDEVWPPPVPQWKKWLAKLWARIRRRPVPSDPQPGGLHFEGLFRLIRERNGDWIADVEVLGRETAQSILTANLAVDIALGGLQALLANPEFYSAHRLTARASPAMRVDVWTADGIPPAFSSSNDTPGRAIHSVAFARWLLDAQPGLNSIGNRLTAYLTGTAPLRSSMRHGARPPTGITKLSPNGLIPSASPSSKPRWKFCSARKARSKAQRGLFPPLKLSPV